MNHKYYQSSKYKLDNYFIIKVFPEALKYLYKHFFLDEIITIQALIIYLCLSILNLPLCLLYFSFFNNIFLLVLKGMYLKLFFSSKIFNIFYISFNLNSFLLS